MTTVTILIDNVTHDASLYSEHGLSMLIERDTLSILFDTGASNRCIRNAQRLGKDLSKLTHIVISHGHYDHTGGLMDVLKVARGAALYAHKQIFPPRYSKKTPDVFRTIGVGFTREDLVHQAKRAVFNEREMHIAPGVYLSGEVPRKVEYESNLYTEWDKKKVPDPFPDDQSLIITDDDGIILVLGCCHSGLINNIENAIRITGQKHFKLIIGGTHLMNKSEREILSIISTLSGYAIDRIGLAHCTGKRAVELFLEKFPSKTFYASSGTSITY